MAEHKVEKKKFEPKDVEVGALAEFDNPGDVVEAAARVRAAGYTKWDAYTPFPVHGLEDAMGHRPTILPYVSAICAVLGLTAAVLLQWYTNGVENDWSLSGYQFWISGKTWFALPSSIPIMFELTVLITAIGTFLCVLLVANLPLLSNPLFKHGGFRQGVSTDKFYIAIEAKDPKYARGQTVEFLRTLSPVHADDFVVKSEPTELPRVFVVVGVVVLILAMIPPILIVRKRSTFFADAKIHVIPDMDFQSKFKTQKLDAVFVDNRASRPQVDDTIARGDLMEEERFYEGFITPAGQVEVEDSAETRNVAFQPDAPPTTPGAGPDGQPAAPAKDPNLPEGKAWLDRLPFATLLPYLPPLDPKMDALSLEERVAQRSAELKPAELQSAWTRVIIRGQQRFNIYCAPCHGLTGDGSGLVTKRAIDELRQTDTWAQPKSMYDPTVLPQPVGQIFGTITHGKARMPSYAAQIPTEDRWAIVAYVKALQRSRAPQDGDVTPEMIKDDSLQASK